MKRYGKNWKKETWKRIFCLHIGSTLRVKNMSNYYKNWIFIDIKKFLVINDFKLLRQKGSHVHFYKKVHGKTFLVTVPFHGKQALK